MVAAGFDWGTFFAGVGGLSAVAVAVFTGLAYQMGYRSSRRERKERERRAATRHLLGVRMEQAMAMAYSSATTDQVADAWYAETRRLISAALGKAEETIFRLTPPTDEILKMTKQGIFTAHQAQLHVAADGLASLIRRFDELPLVDDFNATDWSPK